VTDRQTQLLRDVALLAQLACDSHKRRAARVRSIISKLAELGKTTHNASALREHIRASSDATDHDVYVEGTQLIIETPINIDIQELSRRMIW